MTSLRSSQKIKLEEQDFVIELSPLKLNEKFKNKIVLLFRKKTHDIIIEKQRIEYKKEQNSRIQI